jgi:predicted TIM-barrel fold metal-dependent hydrolase
MVEPDQPRGVTDLRRLEEQAGVTHAGLIVVAQKGRLEETRARNDAVIDAAKKSGGFFFPIASVHPDDGTGALLELDRLAKLGVRVIKLHPMTQDFDVAAKSVDAIAQRAGMLNLVLLFDGFSPWDANESGKFLKLAIQHPKTRFILAHLGGLRFHEMAVFGWARKFAWYPKNVWFDVSATATFFARSPYREELLWVIRTIGTDRVLFGSDWPADDPATAAEAVRAMGLTEAEERQVFFTNAALLLDLK